MSPYAAPKKSGAALWVVLGIVVLIVAAGLIYYMSSGSNANSNSNTNAVANTNTETNTNVAVNTNTAVNQNTNTTSNINSATNTNTNSSVDTSRWETYRNDEVGISFNYPTDWDQSYYTESVRAQYYRDSIFAARQSYDAESATPGYGEIVVQSIPYSNNSSLNDWVQMNDPVSEAETLVSENSTTVSGENALYRHATNNVAGGVLDTRYVLHGGNIVIIETNSRISTDHPTSQSQFDADAKTFLDSISLF